MFYNLFIGLLDRSVMIPQLHISLRINDAFMHKEVATMLERQAELRIDVSDDMKQCDMIISDTLHLTTQLANELEQPAMMLLFLTHINYQGNDDYTISHSLFPEYTLFTDRFLTRVNEYLGIKTLNIKNRFRRFVRLPPHELSLESRYGVLMLVRVGLSAGHLSGNANKEVGKVHAMLSNIAQTVYREFFGQDMPQDYQMSNVEAA
ncbi:hypothetical protein H7R52_04520 [Weissella confusa]|uniref:Uncharacterized protein n=1 Tax=Weissella confusa TaxID=1583 RepID=A0A923SMS4_WEICO|nr:hypothetical protein [Weissella confusa]